MQARKKVKPRATFLLRAQSVRVFWFRLVLWVATLKRSVRPQNRTLGKMALHLQFNFAIEPGRSTISAKMAKHTIPMPHRGREILVAPVERT